MESILQLFPAQMRPFWKSTAAEASRLQEIRLRAGRPILVVEGGREWMLDVRGKHTSEGERARCLSDEELEAILQHICHYSLYAFEDEIRQGFITAAGGHRIGLAGQVVLNGDGSVRTLKHIFYMNIRISHEVRGAADPLLSRLYEGDQLKNLLIISPPGCGKTTLLRDLIRQISDGNPYGKGMCVGVVDERSELAGSYLGHPQNDLGCRTDVLDACPKALGMMLLLRSMAPKVIAIDELGGEADMEALRTAASCGSHIIATVHGSCLQDFWSKRGADKLLDEGLFDMALILGKKSGTPVIQKIYERTEIYAAYSGRYYDHGRKPGPGTMVPGTILRQAPRFVQTPGYPGCPDQ